MKQLFIFILLSVGFAAFAQNQTQFSDLPSKTTRTGSDELTIMSAGIPYRQTISVVQAPLYDSIESIRSIAVSGDSSWVSIEVDTINMNDVKLFDSGVDLIIGNSTPGLYFGDGDTGFDENTDDNILVMVDGGLSVQFSPTVTYFNNFLRPVTTGSLNFGSSAAWWNYGYLNRLYLNNVSNVIAGSATDISFSSTDAGTIYLADIDTSTVDLSGIRDTLSAHDDSIAALRADIPDSTVMADDLDATNTPTDGQFPSYDETSGGFTWEDVSGNVNDSSWTSITTDTINLGDTDTRIRNSAGAILFGTGGNTRFQLNNSTSHYLYGSLIPSAIKTYDLGNSVQFWRNAYIDRLYIDNTSTYLDVSGDDMTLTSTDAGTVNLADLVSGGSDPTDTIELTELVRLLSDTTLLWCWDMTDSSQLVTDKWAARWYHNGPDTLAITSVRAGAVGTSPNFYWNVAYNDSLSYTGDYTKCWTSDLQVTGTDATTIGEVDTSPNNASIPPGNWVFLYIGTATTKPEGGCSFNVYGYEY